MITKEKRKEIIKDIRRLLVEKGKEEELSRIPKYSCYSITLPDCRLEISTLHETSLVEITENSHAEVEYQDTSFDVVKKTYRGYVDGLREVAIKGFYGPDDQGRITLAAEKLLRFEKSTDDRKLTTNDEERFDNWLAYALRELAGL